METRPEWTSLSILKLQKQKQKTKQLNSDKEILWNLGTYIDSNFHEI